MRGKAIKSFLLLVVAGVILAAAWDSCFGDNCSPEVKIGSYSLYGASLISLWWVATFKRQSR